MKYFSFLLLIALLPIFAQAQTSYTLSGLITDSLSGETLINAVVSAQVAGKTLGAVSNEYGFYSITLPAGAYSVKVSYTGYDAQTQEINLSKNTTLDFRMKLKGNELKEVVVKATNRNDNIKVNQAGMERLSVKDIHNIPVLFGEKDVLKTLQLLPGIKTVGDGNSGFYVRGGGADQNLILLDEATVYNPNHLLGFFSTFNSDAIKDVTVYKGGMPSQYGGRLSSVADIKMNDGNNQRFGVSGGIGLISSKLNIEGPIDSGKSSFLLSARRTYADVFLKLSPDSSINTTKLYFYDLNGKVNYTLSKRDKLFLSGYFGQDKLSFSDNFGIEWGNATGTLRWNHLINSKVFSNTSLIYSDYNYNIFASNAGTKFKIQSEIKDWHVKEEITMFPNPQHTVRMGLDVIYHTITPGAVTSESAGTSAGFSLSNRNSLESALYASNKWKVSERFNMEYGLRISSFAVLGGSNYYALDNANQILDTLLYDKGKVVKNYINPEPRLSATYIINEKSSLKGSFARNAQYLHLISNSTSSDPTDKWISTNNNIKPGISDQVSIGYFRNLQDNKYQLSAETYYKSLQNQIDYKDGANVFSNDAIETQLLFGQGRAYGLELLFKKVEGRFTGWISYTLSRTERQINGINRGEWYAARQDRTHDIAIVGMYNASPKWTLSATWIYYTGDAITFPNGKYNVANQVVFYYTDRNQYRMPAYHRLDLGATCKLRQKKRFSSELQFSLYNAYGRENAFTISFRQSEKNPQQTEAVQTSLFRFIPSISYNFKF
jgi:hypothetical protein